jgi:hypothetical protein
MAVLEVDDKTGIVKLNGEEVGKVDPGPVPGTWMGGDDPISFDNILDAALAEVKGLFPLI